MSAILASVLPDFSDAVKPPAPRATPWMPTRVVKLPPRQAEAEMPARPAMPLQPMTVPEALNALQVLVNPAPPPAPAPVATPAPTPEPVPVSLDSPWTGLKRTSLTPEAEPVETPEERAALIADAEARGREQGLAEARAEALAALEAEREAFAASLAEERAKWCESEADRLSSAFTAALSALDADLTQRIGRLLVPVLTDALRRRAMDELAVSLGRLLADPGHAVIRVSGPEDLLDALREKLGPLAGPVTFEPGDAPEVAVVADRTVMETQLAAWTRVLAAAAAES